ncbi:MAG: metal ABC transporter permease [bacterium]|nr:metal ABC transporter permease [bacterium]
MLEIFNYSFMIRAIIAGSVIACVAPLVGTFLVTKRYSLMADTLSHVCLAGIAIGLLLNIYPIYAALVVSILAALMIERLSKYKRFTSEATLSVFLTGGLALATVLISFAKGFTVDLYSYLFGSITTVTELDVTLTVVMGIVVFLVMIVIYKQLFYISFDEESAQVSGLKTKLINYIFIIITATTITLSIRIVGALLVSALIVIPVLCASLVGNSFKQCLIYSIVFGLIFVLTGLLLSFYFSLAAGGSIVLFSLFVFSLILFIKRN